MFTDPSENIIKTKPKIKTKLLNFIDPNWPLDLMTKQLATKPETIIYNGSINLLYISWKTEFTELSSQTNNFSKNPSFLLKNEPMHSINFNESVSCIFGKTVDLVVNLDKLNSVFSNWIIFVFLISTFIIFPSYKIK